MIRKLPAMCMFAVVLSLGHGNTVSAQTAEATYRVNQLEEQVRQLNGKVEDLTFQLLQLQEQLRKMQEDNEFRFQELEDRSDVSGGSKKRKSIGDLIDPAKMQNLEESLGKPEPSEQQADAERLGGKIASIDPEAGGKRMIDGVEIYDGQSGLRAERPKPLGTIIYDAEGNVIDSAIGVPIDLTKGLYGGSDAKVRTAVPVDAEETYRLGYNYMQSGDYDLAEETFLGFIERFPGHLRTPDVNFWLGESHFSRRQFEKAAKIFLNSHRNWPDARMAPQTLLKLGVSLAAMNQRELACATYAEVTQKYPSSSAMVRRNVTAEQNAARCLVN